MDQFESAANIEFSINVSGDSEALDDDEDSVTVPIASIDATKDVEIEQIRGNSVKPIGWSLTEIEFSGSVTFDGNGFVEVDGDVYHLEELFTDDNGYPVTGSEIIIYHDTETVQGGGTKQTVYEDVMVTSDAYETDTGDVSGVTFDFIAGDRTREEVDE